MNLSTGYELRQNVASVATVSEIRCSMQLHLFHYVNAFYLTLEIFTVNKLPTEKENERKNYLSRSEKGRGRGGVVREKGGRGKGKGAKLQGIHIDLNIIIFHLSRYKHSRLLHTISMYIKPRKRIEERARRE